MNNTTTTKQVPKLKPLAFYQQVSLGADPEFFFSKGGTVVGSEKVLPEQGLMGRFVRDGVQAELNPNASTCRALLGNEIHQCFYRLYRDIISNSPDLNIEVTSCVKISQEELDSLSEKSKVFGCAPSNNVYNAEGDKTSKITVNPKKYLRRSAGGHIHLGNIYKTYLDPKHGSLYNRDCNFTSVYNIGFRTERAFTENLETMVKMMDIIVGNTCVMIDRDPNNKERRQVYGKAGEHRKKDYGFEYRTLSNFWLRSYQLMSFVMGLSRMAVLLVEQSVENNDYAKAIFDAVDMDDVVKAINENDFDLAYDNFKKIEPIILSITNNDFYVGSFPLHPKTIKYFHYFVSKGIDYWFKENPLIHWIRLPDGHGIGWESFLQKTVHADLVSKGIDLNDPKNFVAKNPKHKLPVVEREEVIA